VKLSQREKIIAIGLGATILLVIIWQSAVSPYFDRLDDIQKQYSSAVDQQNSVLTLFSRRKKLQTVWTDILKGGLKSNASDAASQMQHAVIDWENAAGVNETAFKPERTVDADQFSILSYRLTERGSMWSIAKLLAKFETATIPVRVNEVQITPEKEGTDALLLQLSISTLCQRPAAPVSTVAENNSEEVR
jgi:hypothetical protein